MKKYIAKMQLIRRYDNKTYEPGEVADLSHLTDMEIQKVINVGGVTVIESDYAVSELEAVRGITPAHATALAEQNIRTLAQLDQADPEDMALLLEGVTAKTFRKWQTTAREALAASSEAAG